jgi:PPOX class probable F420-dependent enzyme
MVEIPASHRDLLESNQVAVLATVGADGVPQVTAAWFVVDDDGLVKMSLHPARQKTKNLLRHPECTLFFVDPATPYRTLEIRARAELQRDPDYELADKVGARYGANLRSMDQPGEVRQAVTFVPVKVNTYGK